MAFMYNADDNSGSGNQKDFKQKLSTEFPLSGGEGEDDLGKIFSFGDSTDEATEEENKKEFKRRLNTEFPLSGGEADL